MTIIKIFLDSNVVANWLLIDMQIRQIRKRMKNRDNISKRIKYILSLEKTQARDYELIERIKKKKFNQHIFYISEFVILEAFTVLVEEYFLRASHKKGILITYLKKSKKRTELSEADADEMVDGLERLGKISRKGIIEVIYFPTYSLPIAFDLIANYNQHASDAKLLAIAIKNGCKLFVTNDSEITKSMKEFEQIETKLTDNFLRDEDKQTQNSHQKSK